MNLAVRPARALHGKIILPASKSYSIRALLIAACGGRSHLKNVSACDDARAALRCARSLGAKVIARSSSQVIISGGLIKTNFQRLNVGESGTVLRFCLPLLALRPGRSIIAGEGTLRQRPNEPLVKILRDMGRDVRGQGRMQKVPIAIGAGQLSGGRLSIDGTLSSQFISALLIACPMMSDDTRLRIEGTKPVSRTYVVMTQRILQRSGIMIRSKGPRLFLITGRQCFKGLGNFTVPADHGLAAFFLAAGALAKSRLTLQGALGLDLPQADGKIFDLLKKMGVRFVKTARAIRIEGPFCLKGGDFCLRDCPDLVPIMAVLALFAKGRTRLYGIRHARAKESDRITDLRRELEKIGARISEKPDAITVDPQTSYREGVRLDPHRDHRLAMAFSVLGLKVPVVIEDIECTAKSYPDFLKDFRAISGKSAKIITNL